VIVWAEEVVYQNRLAWIWGKPKENLKGKTPRKSLQQAIRRSDRREAQAISGVPQVKTTVLRSRRSATSSTSMS